VIGRGLVALARVGEGLYLNMELRSMRQQCRADEACLFRWSHMAPQLTTPQQMSSSIQPPRRIAQAIVTGGVVVGVAVVLAALVLWFHYGTAVFFEAIAAGISACF
jgi:hypothetical protein